MKSTARGGFDSWSRTYDQSPLQAVFFDRVHAALARAVVPLVSSAASPAILDVGCGTGRLLIRLRAAVPGAHLIGVDPSPGMIDVARHKPELADASLQVASAAALPVDDACVDAVVSTMSFHHWEDQASGLRGVSRVLRPGGWMLLADVYAFGPLTTLVRLFGRGHGVGMRNREELNQLLGHAGLRLLELRRIGPPVSPLGIAVAVRPEVASHDA